MDNDDYDYLVAECLEASNQEDDVDVLRSLNEEVPALLRKTIQ